MIDKNHYNLEEVSLKGEKWVVIDDLEELKIYKISNFGRVFNSKTNQFLYGRFNKDNYLGITFWVTGRKFKSFLMHRLIAKYFIYNDNPKYKTTVNHIDGNPRNNSVENLEWVTPHENYQHAIKMGRLDNQGEKNCGAKLTNEQVLNIRANIENKPIWELAKDYGVARRSILNIQTRKSWTHI